MSEGVITANLGGAKYSVKLVYDDSGWLARVATTNASIADALLKQNELTIAVDDAFVASIAAQDALNTIIAGKLYSTKPYVDAVNKTSRAYRLAQLNFNRNRAAIDTGRMQLRWLNSVQPNHGMVVDIYCADFDDTLAVGLHVGLLEINNENPLKQGYIIHPNKTHVADIGDATYDYARDGSMVTAASIQSSANWFFNEALYIGWQKYQPLYRRGVVDAVYPASATVSGVAEVDVVLDAAISSRHPEGKSFGLNRNPSNTRDMLQTKGIPVWYMDAAGTATVGDNAILLYFAQNLNDAKLIGLSDSSGVPPNHGANTGTGFLDYYIDIAGSMFLFDAQRAWRVQVTIQAYAVYNVQVTPFFGSAGFSVIVDMSATVPAAIYNNEPQNLVRSAAGFSLFLIPLAVNGDRATINFSIDVAAGTVTGIYSASYNTVKSLGNIVWQSPDPVVVAPDGTTPSLSASALFYLPQNGKSLSYPYTTVFRARSNTVEEYTLEQWTEYHDAVFGAGTLQGSGYINWAVGAALPQAIGWSALGAHTVFNAASRDANGLLTYGTFKVDGVTYSHDSAITVAGDFIGASPRLDIVGDSIWTHTLIAATSGAGLVQVFVLARMFIHSSTTLVWASPVDGTDWSNLQTLTFQNNGEALSATDLALLQLQTPL